jgi:transcriptional regulator with XRE-family HTH domain
MHGPSTEILGQAIRQIRTRRGISQGQLARLVGLHPTYIGGVERGERNPTWRSLTLLASGLGVALSQVVAEAEALASARDRPVDAERPRVKGTS